MFDNIVGIKQTASLLRVGPIQIGYLRRLLPSPLRCSTTHL